jgi:hypothetical protein
LLERDEVPAAKSDFSSRATENPRLAASRATPAPVIPPPTTTTSNGSAVRARTASLRGIMVARGYVPAIRLLALAGVASVVWFAALAAAGSADAPPPRSDQDPSYGGAGGGGASLQLALITRTTKQMRRSSRLKLSVTVNAPVVVQVGAKVKPVAKRRRHHRRRGRAARRRARTTTLKPANLIFLVPATKHVTFRLPRALRKRLNHRRAKIAVSGTAVDVGARVTRAGLHKRLR